MNGKKMIITAALLGIVSFAGSYFITGMFYQPPVASDDQEPVDKEEDIFSRNEAVLNQLTEAGDRELMPKERLLDKLINEVKLQKEALDRKKKELSSKEKRLDLAMSELRKQSRELGELRVKLAASMTPLRKARKEMMLDRVFISKQEAINLKSTAKMYEKMEPKNAAKILVDMISTDKGDAAVKLINALSDKARAAIMDEIKDSAPAMKITVGQMRVVKEADKAAG